MLNSVQVLQHWVTNTADCGQCVTHRWTVSGPPDRGAAVSRSLSFCSPLHYFTDTRPRRRDAQRHLRLSLIAWVYGKWRGSRRRGCRRAFCLRAKSLLSNRQRKDDLWIEALWRLQWLRGRRITGGNGNVSFTWRLRGWMPLCWATWVSVIGKIDWFPPAEEQSGRIKPGFDGREIEILMHKTAVILSRSNIICYDILSTSTSNKKPGNR